MAIQSLEGLLGLLHEQGIVLINDYGQTEVTRTDDFEHQRFSQATSVGLNFPLLSDFNKHVIQHRFCTACGVESYAEGAMPDGTPTVGINLRCLEDVDVDKLSPRPWDGRSV